MIKIKFGSDTLLRDIQKEFNEKYPYLRLEFHRQFNNSTGEKVNSSVPVGRLWDALHTQCIDISEERTISQLEEDFNRLKLFICVHRKSGRSWIPTSITKDWTLIQQNYEGEMMSRINETTPKDEIDWDIW